MNQLKLFIQTERLEPCYDDPPIEEEVYTTGWQIIYDKILREEVSFTPLPEIDNVIEFPNKELGRTCCKDMRLGDW